MSLIPRSKFGDCSNCDVQNTECVKVGKYLFCLKCRNADKMKKQVEKASAKILKRSDLESDKSYLIQDLDDAISRYVRIKEADSIGRVNCYTCTSRGHWKEFDCGHYIPRANMSLRWDLRNLRPQCKTCNQLNYGNIESFAKNLNEEQAGLAAQLLDDSREPYKWSRDEMKQLLIDIRAKLKVVETKIIS